ncbi:MAG: signal recognition particle protein [Candidatus Coatesbacteria bacterium]|nr:signal recognition particle protein [Candidatus Coatesbacteria bacterium]
MFERLTERLGVLFKRLTGRGKLSEDNVKEALREVRVALLEADVNLRVVKDFLKSVKEKALGAEVLNSLTPGQHFIGVVKEELTALLEGAGDKLNLPKPATVLLVGLQGSGKTTTAAKLARHYQKSQGRESLLVACDTRRPAAREQLVRLADLIKADVHPRKPFTKDAPGTAREGVKLAAAAGRELTIIDTAGRLQIDEELMVELEELEAGLKPQAVWLVVDAMTGQAALEVAAEFHRRLELDGVIVSKLDGDARGGCILSIAGGLGVPVRFVGTGERPEDLEPFRAEGLAGRILGMGDVVGLVERAREVYDEKQAARLGEKMLKGGFDLEDFREQLVAIRKMGDVNEIMAMVPGMRNLAAGTSASADGEQTEVELRRSLAVIDSMTPRERRHPNIIKGSRRRRIAAGAGVSVARVNRLLGQYRQMAKALGGMSGKRGRRRLKQLGIDPRSFDPADLAGL